MPSAGRSAILRGNVEGSEAVKIHGLIFHLSPGQVFPIYSCKEFLFRRQDFPDGRENSSRYDAIPREEELGMESQQFVQGWGVFCVPKLVFSGGTTVAF